MGRNGYEKAVTGIMETAKARINCFMREASRGGAGAKFDSLDRNAFLCMGLG